MDRKPADAGPTGDNKMNRHGERAAKYLTELAKISEPGAGVTRMPFTEEHRQANEMVSRWMRDAGMQVHMDDAGTLFGRLPGKTGKRCLLMGSHQDSVRHGGAYDGIMGVVLPILLVERLRELGLRLDFDLECLAFADEEGVRFPTALLGPRALAGTVEEGVLDYCDTKGISLGQAMREFGLEPGFLGESKRDPERIIAFVETHIEQGPVLEDANEALGIVSAISGIERHQLSFVGETAHAGTMPMELRHDALAAAARFISAVEDLARSSRKLIATVGMINVEPNVVNAIPGKVDLTIELRSPDDACREELGISLARYAAELAENRSLVYEMKRTYSQAARPCDAAFTAILEKSVKKVGCRGLTLASGATHDASAMADIAPIAMLFVRCRNGVSHHPAEYASPEDMGLAIDALVEFVSLLDR
jgi:allantoate deiminase